MSDNTRGLVVRIPEPYDTWFCRQSCPLFHGCKLSVLKGLGCEPGKGCPWFKTEEKEG